MKVEEKMDVKKLKESKEATQRHIATVQVIMAHMISELVKRSRDHDQSKLQPPEDVGFAEFTDKLKGSTYGSPEYQQFLKDMKPFLDHHYANNSHHPEHYEKGIRGMNILDLLEMLCDWKAAGLRHADGDIRQSIYKNANRFDMPPALVDIFLNSIPLLDEAIPEGWEA